MILEIFCNKGIFNDLFFLQRTRMRNVSYVHFFQAIKGASYVIANSLKDYKRKIFIKTTLSISICGTSEFQMNALRLRPGGCRWAIMSHIYEMVRNYLRTRMRAVGLSTLYSDNVLLSLNASLNKRKRMAMTTPRPKNKIPLTKSRLQL